MRPRGCRAREPLGPGYSGRRRLEGCRDPGPGGGRGLKKTCYITSDRRSALGLLLLSQLRAQAFAPPLPRRLQPGSGLGEWSVRRAPRSLRTVWSLVSPAAPLFCPALLVLCWLLFREDESGTPEEKSFRNWRGRGLSLGVGVGEESLKVFETVPNGKKVLIFLGGPGVTRNRRLRQFLASWLHSEVVEWKVAQDGQNIFGKPLEKE